jgi:hypothetical protein
LYGVSRNGKFGVIDEQAMEVQPFAFDSVYAMGAPGRTVSGYQVAGKEGFFDSKGRKTTEALYEEPYAYSGGLVLAQREGRTWLINVETGLQRAVDFDDLKDPFPDGVRIARRIEREPNTYGLVDAEGNELMPQTVYGALSWGGPGMLAYRAESSNLCGYLDYSGKVVIPAQFSQCESFGRKGALVRARRVEESGSLGAIGMVGRQGEWLQTLPYDGAWAQAGLDMLQGYSNPVPGYAAVSLKYRYGIFSTDEGQEVVAPSYQMMGLLTPELLVYSDANSPGVKISAPGVLGYVPSLGLMDRAGHSLLKPQDLLALLLDPSGRFVHGYDGIYSDAKVGLFDLKGQQLIPLVWQKLEVEAKRGYVLGFEVWRDQEKNEQRELRALYDLSGRPAFTVKKLKCGAEQVVGEKGKPIWPLNPMRYCPRKG